MSGEGGAAISRRNYGETIRHITDSTRYAYQFAHNYQSYGDRVDQLPFDGHMLISLIAPRPLLLQTGDTDYWSDPKGEYLAAVAASPVWKLFGTDGLATDHYPAAASRCSARSATRCTRDDTEYWRRTGPCIWSFWSGTGSRKR